MLSALLNSIQSSLGSRGFLVGSVFPVVIFTIGNGLLAFRVSPSFRQWVGTIDSLSQQTFLASALLAGIIVAAYVSSVVASAILEMFEGKRAPVSWFRSVLHAVQLSKLRRLEEQYWSAVRGL